MSLKWLPLLIAPALLAIACGGDGSSPTPSPTPTSTEPALSPTPTQTPEPTPTPTPQPQARIAFLSQYDGNLAIYVMSADGSGLTRLTDNRARDEFPVWSPVP